MTSTTGPAIPSRAPGSGERTGEFAACGFANGRPDGFARPRAAAFTLLELLMIMVILAIVAMVAAPALSTFGKGRGAGNCAEQIVALTRWARTQSITRGITYRLNVDPSSRTYWLTQLRDDGTVDNLGEEFGRVFTAPEGCTVDWNAPVQQDGQYIQFLPTGRTDPATIHVADPRGKVIEITCFSPTELFHVVTDAERRQG